MATPIQIAFQRDPATGQIQFDTQGYPIYNANANANANNYSSMITRVADEVLGSPTTDQIENAIQDAIQTYERQSFWFNNMRFFGDVSGSLSDLQTNSGQEFYSYDDLPVLVNFPHISKITVLVFNNRYSLTSRTNEWIDDQSVSPSWQSWPTDWSWQAGSLRLYPIPNGTYPLIVNATIRFRPLRLGADYSCWTNEAEALIRTEAKRLLFLNITRNRSQVVAMEREILGDASIGKQGLLGYLRRESMGRGSGGGTIRPSRGYM